MTEDELLYRLDRLVERATTIQTLIDALGAHLVRVHGDGEVPLVGDGSRDGESCGSLLHVPARLVDAASILEVAERGAYEACCIDGEPIWPILT
jgi:hypothetical protein